VTLAAIGGSAALLLVQKAIGGSLVAIGGLTVPVGGDWWRLLSAPFAYVDVGYLFVVGVALAIFSVGLERRLGSIPAAVLLLACGSLGMLAAAGIADAQGELAVVGGGNGMALGAVAAWFAIRRVEARHAIDQEYDTVGVAVAVAVLLLLPVFESSADVFAGLAGGVVGGLAGFAASALRRSE